MRLFEVAGNQFQDDLANVLKVMQGRADSKNTTSLIPWQAINNMLASQGYANISYDIMDKIKDRIDPNEELIQNYDEKGITLKTKVATPEEPEVSSKDSTAGKSIDQMASNAASASLK